MAISVNVGDITVRISQPLADRPAVLLIETDDDRLTMLSDGKAEPYTLSECLALARSVTSECVYALEGT